jgi:hypothetical protein
MLSRNTRYKTVKEEEKHGVYDKVVKPDLTRYTEPSLSYQHIVLDSFEKDEASRIEVGEFQWNVALQGSTGFHILGVRDQIDNIRAIIVDPFELPETPLIDYVTNPTVPYTVGLPVLLANPSTPVDPSDAAAHPLKHIMSQFIYGARVTMEIKELSLQSISDRSGMRHTFEYSLVTEDSTGRIVAEPVNPIYDLTDPINNLNHFHIVLRNHDIPLRFDRDCLYRTVVSWEYDDPDIAVDPYFHLTFTYTNHGLALDDLIVINSFLSDNEVMNGYVNYRNGRFIGTLLGADPTKFRLNPDVCIPRDPAAPTVVPTGAGVLRTTILTVYIPKNRLRIPIHFVSHVDRALMKKVYQE